MFFFFFFFFKQKTAYEMLRSLVGSEMCIRDRSDSSQLPAVVALAQKVGNKDFSEVVGEGLALAYSAAMQLSLIHI